MRLDKFLKLSRIIKRRTVANEACDNSYVSVNGRAAKASHDVKPGDIIVGDEDGVVAIRPQHAREIAEAARRLKEQEEANLQLILQGRSDRSWVMKALTEKGCTFIDKAWDEE